MSTQRSHFVVALALAAVLLACNASALAPTPTPTPIPTPTVTPSPTPEPADTGWQSPEAGVEMRRVLVPSGSVQERLLLVRIDPARFDVRVRYTPGSGQSVAQWAATGTPQQLLVVNGGYFTPEYEATGLLVSGQQAYGLSYGDFAGMLAVLPGGRVEVRWLAAQPYDPAEMLLEAVQSFPMLVKPGRVMGFPADADDGTPARRTVVAQDRQGRLLFVLAPRGYLSLHQLARWLAESDLDLDVALNLDGGQSSGLYLAVGDVLVLEDSLLPVPAVIVVERRE